MLPGAHSVRLTAEGWRAVSGSHSPCCQTVVGLLCAQREIDIAASCISEYGHRTTATRGGDQMRLGLFLTTLIGLAGASHISSAADATWAAVGALENGVSTSCGGGSIPLPEWTSPAYGQVDIKGNTLTFTSTSRIPNHSFTVDLKALQPDGSGKVVGKDRNNREFYLTLDPGSGARPFHMTYRLKACRRVYTPTT